MIEWITDRLPENGEGCVWGQTEKGNYCIKLISQLELGEPWCPMEVPWTTDLFEWPKVKRWKPDFGDNYYVICSWGQPSLVIFHTGEIPKRRYKFGNCFRTKKQAQEAARRVRETLKNYHRELNNE